MNYIDFYQFTSILLDYDRFTSIFLNYDRFMKFHIDFVYYLAMAALKAAKRLLKYPENVSNVRMTDEDRHTDN